MNITLGSVRKWWTILVRKPLAAYSIWLVDRARMHPLFFWIAATITAIGFFFSALIALDALAHFKTVF